MSLWLTSDQIHSGPYRADRSDGSLRHGRPSERDETGTEQTRIRQKTNIPSNGEYIRAIFAGWKR